MAEASTSTGSDNPTPAAIAAAQNPPGKTQPPKPAAKPADNEPSSEAVTNAEKNYTQAKKKHVKAINTHNRLVVATNEASKIKDDAQTALQKSEEALNAAHHQEIDKAATSPEELLKSAQEEDKD